MAANGNAWPKDHLKLLSDHLKVPGNTWASAAKVLNETFSTKHTRDSVQAKGIRAGLRIPPPQADVDRLEGKQLELRVIESEPGTRIVTLDELLANAHVDLDEWEVVSYDINKWDSMGLDALKKAMIVEMFQVKAKLRRKDIKTVALVKLRDGLLNDIQCAGSSMPMAMFTSDEPYTPDNQVLFELDPFDLHLGKLCHGDETVTDYTLEHGAHLFRHSVIDLIKKAVGFKPGQWLMVIGNDVTHIDNLSGTTTAGTKMDACARYIQVFRYARKLHSWAIWQLLNSIGPGKVIVVRGNHDNNASFALGEVLEAEFHNNQDVAFDNGARLRKYHEHGVNLIGFTHGSEEKASDLPLLMAREVPELWGRTKLYEWHIGHLHKMKETHFTAGDSFAGVRVRILPTLTAHDAWHYKEGYTDRRACEAYLWHAKAGYIGHLSTNVDHHSGKEMVCSDD